MSVRKLCILGSTGSIGTQALSLVDRLGIEITALSANSNIGRLEDQIRQFRPHIACVADEAAARDLAVRVADTNTKVLSGKEGMNSTAVETDCDTVLNSVVGIAGLLPTMAALEAGKDVALANKETLVTGGKLVTEKVREKGVRLIPVDSEHSAIFQCLQDRESAVSLRRILLTASGGPFWGWSKEQLRDVTAADALKHPNWSMGRKITIDSATMMNKAFELMEAMWLFDLPASSIDITIHRQSILHSGVEFEDGAILAQLGVPDMRLPIQYALTYPKRMACDEEHLTIERMASLTFERPDLDTFTCLAAGIRAAEKGGLAPTAANAANEIAVQKFLDGEIGFLDIGDLVSEAVENTVKCDGFTLENIVEFDREVRAATLEKCSKIEKKD